LITGSIGLVVMFSMKPSEFKQFNDSPKFSTALNLDKHVESSTPQILNIRLKAIIAVEGSTLPPQALMALNDGSEQYYKEGSDLSNGWRLLKINADHIVIADPHQTQVIALAAPSVQSTQTNQESEEQKNWRIENEKKLNFSKTVKPNLNKPDFVDDATWADMKSKYGL